jgi:hypothetical protein
MNRRYRQSGFIVLVVMVVIVMLTLAGLAFVLNLSLENKAVHLQGDQQQLQQTLASGVELMRGFLAQTPSERQQAGGTFQNAAVFAAVAVSPDSAAGDDTRFSVVSPQNESEASSGVRFGLQNESARLNLAALADWDAAEPGAARNALLQLPGMTDAIADAILDWIDGDDVPRDSGAEADYYIGRGLPYEPRNNVPVVLDELLLVRDVSRSSLFGADTNFNYREEPGETQQTGGAGDATGGQTPWCRLLTLYSAEANRTFQGEPRIFLNHAELKTLHQQLTAAFDRKAADFVVAYRQFGPYDPTAKPTPRRKAPSAKAGTSQRSSAKRPSGDGQGLLLDLAQPPEYEIASILDLIEARVVLPPDEEPEIDADDLLDLDLADSARDVENPFDEQRDRLREYLPEWFELTTTTDAPVLRGRVHLNEAARPVLLGVPGLDESLADRIISTRGGFSADSSAEYRHPTWLYTEGLVDRQQMRQLEPYLTCGGDVYRAQVVAFGGSSGLAARAEVVLDASVSPPRQVYWKDLGLLGRGFTDEELGLESGLR